MILQVFFFIIFWVKLSENHEFGHLKDTPQVLPNTLVFTPTAWYGPDGQTGTDLQQKVDDIFSKQENNEFGDERYGLLFLPGVYETLHITVGYYTSIIGLGKVPDDVSFHGNIEVKNKQCPSPGALCNFWRSVENVHVVPNGGNMFWRVSQAAPIRQIHVEGNLFFAQDPGWSSGGFMSDSLISNLALGQTQQQWFTRNSKFSQFQEIAWNAVCVGCEGTVGGNKDCKDDAALWHDIKQVPLVAPKPYLFFDNEKSEYAVMVPNVVKDSSGVLPWGEGTVLPLSSSFYIAKQGDSAETINSQLDQGKNLLLTPGVYELSETLRVSKNGSVILGLAYATLVPTAGNAAMIVADDAVGVRLASFMVQAGETRSDVLIKIGENGPQKQLRRGSRRFGSEQNPTVLSDVFGRVGGQSDKQSAATMMEINQDWVVVDDVWLWRADHDKFGKNTGLGPTNAVSDHALVVNGNHVYTYGLMTEHTLKELILWNGDDGKMFFLQSELAYDVPDEWDYPALRIGDNVTTYEAWGLGIYSFFAKKWNVNGPKCSTAIVAPQNKPNVVVHTGMSLFLNADGGRGIITHVVNDIGNESSADDADRPQWASWNDQKCPHHN